MRKILQWLAVAICAVPLGVANAQEFEPQAEQELFALVNAERANRGLGKLEMDSRLTEIARKHSMMMAQRKQLSHQFDGEPEVRDRIAATGMRFNFSGENVGYNSGDAEDAHENLMNSPPHRANILRHHFNSIGIGIVRVGEILYVTEDFARRLPEVSLDEAERVIDKSFAKLRRSSGAKPLPRIAQPGLRKQACELAAQDRLNPARIGPFKGVQNIVLWTATELEELPPSMQKLSDVEASGYSLGTCLSTSRSHPNAVFWVALVTYY